MGHWICEWAPEQGKAMTPTSDIERAFARVREAKRRLMSPPDAFAQSDTRPKAACPKQGRGAELEAGSGEGNSQQVPKP